MIHRRLNPHQRRQSTKSGLFLAIPVILICLTPYPGLALHRDADPVILTGADLPEFTGLSPDQIVGFRYGPEWEQIPIQIDERKWVDFGQVYNADPIGLGIITYADPETYTGSDTNPAFDTDDELVFMARDTGDISTVFTGLPLEVYPESAVELTVTDPLDGSVGYLYLFATDGTLPGDAGQDYVTYTFDFTGGTYIPDYDVMAGPNPENSTAVSPYYRTHFSDMWIRDELNVYSGSATGVNILDRHKNLFAPGNCTRSEDTFSAGEGAFFVNRDGPIRGIRSYMGANSGPLTQREHHFYDRRQDVLTNLRVHIINGIMDFYDYSPAAAGMIYFNDNNTGGVPVDGTPDAVVAGPILWEMITGAPGTVTISHSIITDIVPFAYTSYYSDDISPLYTQCTGDAWEYAAGGLWIDQFIPNTDPTQSGDVFTLINTRTIYYDPPDQTVPDAELRNQQAGTPLIITMRALCIHHGDPNFDGEFTAGDAQLAFNFALEILIPTLEESCASDCNGDGDITAGDAQQIFGCIFGSSCENPLPFQ